MCFRTKSITPEELIPATEDEKLNLLKYEIKMFRFTCYRLLESNYVNQFELNLLLESLAVHARILIDFFYNKKNKYYPNDLIAKDLLSIDQDWRPSSKPQFLIDIKQKADRQLAHLSLWRLKYKREKQEGWSAPPILKVIETLIHDFEKASEIDLSNQNF